MALVTHGSGEYSALIYRSGAHGAPKLGGDGPAGGGTAIVDRRSLESNTAQHHICPKCALPLKMSVHSQDLECSCMQDEFEDDWLDLGGWEIALVLVLGISCMAVSFWFCI